MKCSFCFLYTLVLIVNLSANLFGQDAKDVAVVNDSIAKIISANAQVGTAQAQIITAQGGFRKNAAEAAKIDQETRKLSLENELLKAKTFYDKKGLYNQYKASQKTIWTAEQQADVARRQGPGRLTDADLQSATRLNWPQVLMTDEFASDRLLVDGTWDQRSPGDSGTGSATCREITQATQRLQQVLKRMVRDLPSGEYIHAQNFLKRVAHEASFSVLDTTGQLAQN